MSDSNKPLCDRPGGGPVGQDAQPAQPDEPRIEQEKGGTMITVGQKAPDFEAPAYFKGEFTNVKLSSYLGKWVVLCFYPGDFTFV